MTTPSLSFTGLFVLQAVSQGHRFGFDIMEITGLPSGTIYPALRRLESLALVTSGWEQDAKARKEGRPRRRYYELTAAGRKQLGEAENRFLAVNRLFPKRRTT
jgi:PadR family transcriptional regulator PadR